MRLGFAISTLVISGGMSAGLVHGQSASGPSAEAPLEAGQLAGSGLAVGESEAIEALIAQLSADDWVARNRAVGELVRHGTEAAVRLEALVASDATPLEARSAARAALAGIEAERATGPTRVSIDVKDAPLSEVIAELSRQANAALPGSAGGSRTGEVASPDGKRPDGAAVAPTLDVLKLVDFTGRLADAPVTLRIQREPLWEAVVKLCQQVDVRPVVSPTQSASAAGLSANASGQIEPGAIVLGPDRPGGWETLPISHQGRFLVVAEEARWVEQSSLVRGRTTWRTLTVQLAVLAEPKVRIAPGVHTTTRVTAALPDGQIMNGAPVHPTPRVRDHYYMQGIPVVMSLDVPAGAQRPTELATLSGEVSLWQVTETEPLVIDNLGDMVGSAEGSLRRISLEGLDVVVDAVDEISGGYEVRLRLLRTSMPVEHWHRLTRHPTALAQLVDADGRLFRTIYDPHDPDAMYAVGDAALVKLTFYQPLNAADAKAKPARLRWDVPVRFEEQVVPFHFERLPMP